MYQLLLPFSCNRFLEFDIQNDMIEQLVCLKPLPYKMCLCYLHPNFKVNKTAENVYLTESHFER